MLYPELRGEDSSGRLSQRDPVAYVTVFLRSLPPGMHMARPRNRSSLGWSHARRIGRRWKNGGDWRRANDEGPADRGGAFCDFGAERLRFDRRTRVGAKDAQTFARNGLQRRKRRILELYPPRRSSLWVSSPTVPLNLFISNLIFCPVRE